MQKGDPNLLSAMMIGYGVAWGRWVFIWPAVVITWMFSHDVCPTKQPASKHLNRCIDIRAFTHT